MKPKNKKLVAGTLGLAATLVVATTAVAQATGIRLLGNDPSITYPERHYALKPLKLKVFATLAPARQRELASSHGIASAVSALTSNDSGVPTEWLPGRADGAVRVPLAGLGVGSHSIFLVRTTKGRVCGGLTEFASGCLEGLPLDSPATSMAGDLDATGAGEAPVIWGVARDEVRSIDVVVDRTSHRAVLGGNVYFFQLPDNTMSEHAITAIRATLASGKVVEISVVTGPTGPPTGPVVRGGPEVPSS